ncbi:LPS-assembly protein LptD [Inmirania thermothiophila]|uniref:LPS-assembly protein LptD n=1 Tax=Inmirania thermothiophila TaxID=1750597 RepID=A0A3N1YAL6_9GAMM|nr:LPS assembly protein LptD [Inmirania thermothiophila]ROR34672.1 LPS-assembly protein [Inmirania thermothiophila]
MRARILLALLLLAHAAAAADPWDLCLPMDSGQAPRPEPAAGGGTRIRGREVAGDAHRLRARGEARIDTPARVVEAETLDYDRDTGVGTAEEGVRVSDGDTVIEAERARVEDDGARGELEGVRYRILSRHARGGADRVFMEDRDRYRLLGFTYTTCDPTAEFWRLEGPEVRIDMARGSGTAYHANLRIHGVPVFYLPVFSFPVDDRRKTGFLIPRLGSSSETGSELAVPWYWNIAPQYDLTLTPRLTSRRGAFLGVEARHLQRHGAGTLEADLVPEDRLTGGRRWLARWRESGRLGARWLYDLDAARASDTGYFEDFGETLAVASTTHLEQRADLTYAGPRWRTRLRLQAFQTVDGTVAETARPYRRLPALEVLLRNPPRLGPLEPGLRLEATRFEHDVKVEGRRLDLLGSLAWPLRRPWGFVVPRLWARHTAYDLAGPVTGEENPSRSLPGFSLDAGLVLERQTPRFLQTLEPRLFYLRVPYRDQSAIPVFDSARLELTFAGLFRDNRFSGADRVGDADQLTLALTSRLLDADGGRERLRASVGQILHFRDRRVVLPGKAPETAARSALVGELTAALAGGWRVLADARYDTETPRTEEANVRLQYRPDERHILNLAYRFEAEASRQSDLSFRWPLGRRWYTVGRWNRDLDARQDLETFLGLEYESCCWMLRVVGRRFVNDTEGDTNTSFYLQLVLKGLARVGNRLEDILGRGILGYPDGP